MTSVLKQKEGGTDGNTLDHQSKSSVAGSSRCDSRPIVPGPRSVPAANRAHILSQNSVNTLAVTRASIGHQITPVRKVSTFRPPMIAKHADGAFNTYARGMFPDEIKAPQKMLYPANAQPPETPEKLSIYPVTHEMLRIPVAEESTDPPIALGAKTEFNFEYQIQKEWDRFEAHEKNKMLPQPNPAAMKSERMSQQDEETAHQIDVSISDGNTTPREKTKNTRRILHEVMDWDDAASLEDLNKDFSMFDDTPRDASILPEREEWRLPPWDTVDTEGAPVPTDLSSMTEWDPSLDLDFQAEAQENLERWSDCRFKSPQTRADIESLRQALEMTRLDFWIRTPDQEYPDDLSQHETESYASQQRRLQHAFCRTWRLFHSTVAPELFRLPSWMFGFEEFYWKPSSWGYDRQSIVYNQGLAKMAAEKKEIGLGRVNYQEWKARLTEPVTAEMAHIALLALWRSEE